MPWKYNLRPSQSYDLHKAMTLTTLFQKITSTLAKPDYMLVLDFWDSSVLNILLENLIVFK